MLKELRIREQRIEDDEGVVPCCVAHCCTVTNTSQLHERVSERNWRHAIKLIAGCIFSSNQ